jgi:phenylacetate-CoA ligase
MISARFTSREEIHAHQLAELRKLLAAIATGNPFYRSRLERTGLTSELKSLDEYFERMAFTRKEEIAADQQANPPYGTNLTFPLAAYSRFSQTSGTSGVPLRWLDTPESWQSMLDNWKQVFAAADVGTGQSIYFAFSFGPFLGFWTAFEAACQIGCRSLPGGGLSSLARLHAIRDNAAQVLCCTPTYALHLGQIAAENGIDLSELGVRKIIVAGEPGGSVRATRERIEKIWPRAIVYDHHGMTEVGPVTYQCPESQGTLMVIESSYIAEIIEPRGDRPVARGEEGELVLTTLGRTGSPLIRYRTGDLVCENLDIGIGLGRHELALRGGILGRVDDMVLVRGVNLYPAAVENLMLSMPEIALYQVEVDAGGPMTELNLRIEPLAAAGDGSELASRVQSEFRAAFNLRVPVIVCPPGSLPRGEMKSQRWVRSRGVADTR